MGAISQIAHLPSFTGAQGCRILAVTGLRPFRARRVAERYGIRLVYPSHRELLNDSSIDAVVVVTRRDATGPIVLDALEAGKHVFSEKPMALTLEQARRLVETARSKARNYAVGFMKRHDSGVQRAKKLVDDLRRSGKLGGIVMARCRNFCREYVGRVDDYIATNEPPIEPITSWARWPTWIPEESREKYDWFLNVASHNINLLRYLLGSQLTVHAVSMDYPLACSVLLNHDEFPVSLDVGKSATGKWHESVEIYFERGRVVIRLTSIMQRNVSATVVLDTNVGTPETVEWGSDSTWAFHRQAQDFVDSIIERRPPLADGADSLCDMEIIDTIWQTYVKTRT